MSKELVAMKSEAWAEILNLHIQLHSKMINEVTIMDHQSPSEKEDKKPYWQKRILTIDELAEYTGFEKGYLYTLTKERIIPHYKPTGRTLFFLLEEIDQWLLSNRISTQVEDNQIAREWITKNASKGAKNKKGGN